MEPESIQHEQPVRLACSAHADRGAAWICAECGRGWCGACVKQVKLPAGNLVSICPGCQGLCERPAALALEERKSFLQGLGAALVFPLHGGSLVLLLVGAVLDVVSSSLGRSLLFSGLLMIGGLGLGAYCLSFLRSVLLTAAHGDDPPILSAEVDFQNWAEILLQFFGVCLVCFGPATVCQRWLGTGTPGLWWLSYGLWFAGIGCFPLALLAVMIYDSLAGLNPLLILVSIARTFPRYVVLCLMLGAVVGLGLLVDWVLSRFISPLVASALNGALTFYGAVVIMRATGWFYYCTKHRLNWS